MPLYEYRCQSCGRTREVLQKMSDPPLATCGDCGGEMKRLVSAPAVQFKGTGWYVTDYAKKSGGEAGRASGSAEKSSASESSSADSSADKSSSAEKPAATEKSAAADKSGGGEKSGSADKPASTGSAGS